jgi:[protein-PII] uridylyltransferase
MLTARASPFMIAPVVAIDNQASRDATVIEASGRDRPGLLEALARVLSDAGLSIQSAHIDGRGERAVDSFYVVDQAGGKFSDAAGMAQVHLRLAEVLDADPAATPGRLLRARASRAR